MHPVFGIQNSMEGGGVDMPETATAAPTVDGYTNQGSWNQGIPNCVAMMAAGSVLGLLALRLAGFRFSFGVNVGGGGAS